MMKNNRSYFVGAIILSGLFVLMILPFGPGVTFDSISFLQAGENFWSDFSYVHQGNAGTDVFAAHRFPLYPLVLGLFSKIPYGDLVLQITLFGIFTCLFFRLLKKCDLSPYFGAFILAYPIIVSFYSLWTESLFIVLFLAIIFRVWNISQTESKKAFRIILILIVLLCLTRLVGIATAGSVGLFFLFQKKWKYAVFSILAGLIPFFGWTLIGLSNMGETARTFVFHLQPDLFSKLIFGLGESIFPSTLIGGSMIQNIVGIIVLIAPITVLIISRKKKTILNFLILLTVHFYGYLVLLIFCILFIDASIPLEVRTLLPVSLTLFLMIIFSACLSTLEQKKRLVAIPILVVLSSSISLLQLSQNGFGYSSKQWAEFKFVEKLRSIDANKIYTNDQNAIWYFLHQKSIQLPQKSDLYTQKINAIYAEEMAKIIDKLVPGEQIVWIRSGATAAIYPSYDEIKNYPDLEIIYDDWLCVILRKKEELVDQ